MNPIIDEMFFTTNPIMDDTCININSIIDKIFLKNPVRDVIFLDQILQAIHTNQQIPSGMEY